MNRSTVRRVALLGAGFVGVWLTVRYVLPIAVPFLVGLIEKLALGLSKKLAGLAIRARNYLDRVKQVCDCELEEVFPEFVE